MENCTKGEGVLAERSMLEVVRSRELAASICFCLFFVFCSVTDNFEFNEQTPHHSGNTRESRGRRVYMRRWAHSSYACPQTRGEEEWGW